MAIIVGNLDEHVECIKIVIKEFASGNGMLTWTKQHNQTSINQDGV
jgi:hypothetical protein